MDFFSSQDHQRLPSTTPGSTDQFAQQISRRFPQPLLTARLSPVVVTIPQQSPSSSSSTTTTTTSPLTPQAKLVSLTLRSPSTPLDARISSVDPAALPALLETPHLLVLDIRPHANYSQSRIPHALSLSFPSTLLKRPAYPLLKLTEMLSSTFARRKFSDWQSATRILVYDSDSKFVPEGSTIRSLLRKFDNEGFSGDLSWIKGGFSAVWRERRNLVDNSPPSPDSSEDDDIAIGYLRTRRLPSSAFQQSSTTTARYRPPLTHPAASHLSVAPAPSSTRLLAANPFYDSIRQNRELEHGITERMPLRLPPSVISRRNDLPFDWLKEIVDKADVEEGTEALAMQFYMIELREQRRLMGVMDYHSRQVRSLSAPPLFPYSITAGIEKGSKNRYQNIWPFEHSRVKLQSRSIDDGSDYINASHVQPLGTRRKYIATQGPLPTTYADFWTLCWEQNVRIILMLTKQVEGAQEKCGCYWRENSYGPLRLEPLSSTGDEEIEVRSAPPTLGFDFGVPTMPEDAEKATVRRTFLLSHVDHPEVLPRKVTQIQYLGWPDYDVPDNPQGILGPIRMVDALRAENGDAGSPLLLHCSAGIGRTGGFILADAALDGIRREMGKRQRSTKHLDIVIETENEMDIDNVDSSPSLGRRFSRRKRQHLQTDHEGSSGLTSDDSFPSSLQSFHQSTSAANPSTSMLLPSAISADTFPRMPKPRSAFPVLGEVGEGSSSSKRRAGVLSGNDSSFTSSSTLPSIFSEKDQSNRDGSATATSLQPISVESSRSTSPVDGAETFQETTFDYTNPRGQPYAKGSPKLLSHYPEPIRNILEDMREQRMSLCQTLRQYVFVHRAIVEGALDIVDEMRAGQRQADVEEGKKRQPSPTELPMIDKCGIERFPSFKRRDRSSAPSVSTAAQ